MSSGRKSEKVWVHENYTNTFKYENKPSAKWHLSAYKGVQARFETCTSKIEDVWLTTKTTIICFIFYVFPFHIQIIEETTIENGVHETMVLSL